MNLSKKGERSRAELGKMYAQSLGNGLHLCFRRGQNGGTWTAKLKRKGQGTKYDYQRLGAVASGSGGWETGMEYEAALTACKAWANKHLHNDIETGHYTVADAMAAYLKKCKKRTMPQYVINAHILPTLGDIKLVNLRQHHIQNWFNELENGISAKKSPDALRAKQSSCNRYLNLLKAALNLAYKQEKCDSKSAWDRIERFKDVDVIRDRYLSIEEASRLLDACTDEFRPLVKTALFTGCRWGEVCALTVGNYNPDSGKLRIVTSKTGKGRYIPLTDEAIEFFAGIVAGRKPSEHMFTHIGGECDGQPFKTNQQTLRMQSACKKAGIQPPVGFHGLRHTVASHLSMNSTDLPSIADILGHSSTRMTQRYAHLSDDYVAKQMRANLPSFSAAKT